MSHGTIGQEDDAPPSIRARFDAATIRYTSAVQHRIGMSRALANADDAIDAAAEEYAVAAVEAGAVDPRFRLATSAILWEALRSKAGVSTAGGSIACPDNPGPGFMRLYVGLLTYWIPCRHYWAWSDEVSAAAKAKREAGK